MTTKARADDRALGCILGGAIGDALGAPVEFDRTPRISDLLSWRGRIAGSWTDDTEMTIATADAIIAWDERGVPLPTALWDAYRRWRRTCDHGRAPGMTCLSATAQTEPGTVARPINDSKGCGGVMRVAPLGVALEPAHAFALGVAAAAMTHSHPLGYLPAGVLASWASRLIDGQPLGDALEAALCHLAGQGEPGEELARLLDRARRLARTAGEDRTAIAALGEGWTGEEALAIATFCAFRYEVDTRTALLAAANHPGDSDSTASICGQILGAAKGLDTVPAEWRRDVEQRDRLISLASQLAMVRAYQGGP